MAVMSGEGCAVWHADAVVGALVRGLRRVWWVVVVALVGGVQCSTYSANYLLSALLFYSSCFYSMFYDLALTPVTCVLAIHSLKLTCTASFLCIIGSANLTEWQACKRP